MIKYNGSYPTCAKVIHLGLVVFGITAYLTGEFAENGNGSLGYLLHAYLGMSLTATMLVRIGFGFTSSQALSFEGWSPFSRVQWRLALEDFRALLRLTVPDRARHQGLAGITQSFGLVIFAWMAITGTGLFILGSGPESQAFELIEELHEVGESLIPLYLALHVGAVILHTIGGNPIWQKMFMFKKHNKL